MRTLERKGKTMYDNIIVALEDSIKIWNVLVATGGRDKEQVINKLFSINYLPDKKTGFYKGCPLCQYAWEVTGTPGTERCEACPVDWSWDWGMGKRDHNSKLPMYCYDGIFEAWERARIPVKRVELAIEIVARMEAALDMYRSIEGIGE